MKYRFLLAVAFWCLVGCQTPQSSMPVACPQRSEQADRLYEAGLAQLDASRDGEHYRAAPFDEAMQTLQAAADAGSRDAQSLYGRTLFGALFGQQAPAPDQREQYVSALVALRLAARAGDAEAAHFLPTWGDDEPDRSRPPLDALPPAWLDEALARAKLREGCLAASARFSAGRGGRAGCG